MNRPIIILFLTLFIFSCKTEKESQNAKEYLRWVGDIEKDTLNDNLNFKVCNGDDQILQYFNLGEGPVYKGEKSKVLNKFKSNFKQVTDKEQNGLIRIRFVVNCEGKADRFRILQSDYNYQEIQFDKRIITQLTNITKGIESWQILYRDEVLIDYYMYLIIKITDGEITEILP
ncbi:hypothetical protein [Psychroflexus sp. MES1-P1E]|uniref:hypothetical protein n=1 Tax=Psychroflexus sp. MES1-P1E TaxID=2058320 RepID=UPI000C7DB817|nr:hypothetical protein [Psychroflexus sp. MES1-P1E]PKG43623.1 hypothetical protein CXF67_04005 [Psychroflexus sp. MES1-P1E]